MSVQYEEKEKTMLKVITDLNEIPKKFTRAVTFIIRLNSFPLLQRESYDNQFVYFMEWNKQTLRNVLVKHLIEQQQHHLINCVNIADHYSVSYDEDKGIYYLDLVLISPRPFSMIWFKQLGSIVGRYSTAFK